MQLRMTVEHFGLAAHDPPALAQWYKKMLSGELIFRCENDGRPPTLFIRLGDGLVIEIYPAATSGAAASDNSTAGWRHLALQVTSITTARAELEARGVQFTEPIKPAGGGGQVLFFVDPEGNLLHLVERPPGSVFGQALNAPEK